MQPKLFVGQIPPECDEAYLQSLFSAYGEVTEVFLIKDKSTGRPKGSAFVKFADTNAAQLAIQSLDQQYVLASSSRPMAVRFAASQGTEDAPPSAERKKLIPHRGGRKLFVGQIPRTMTEAELLGFMSPYGAIEECVVLRDKATHEGKGAGFVVFSAAADAEQAVRALHNQVILPPGKKPVQVKYAEGETPPAGEPKLFAGLIGRSTTEDDILEVFGQFGNLTEIIILKKQGQSQGACFVKYDSLDSCDAAIRALDGKFIMPRGSRPMSVKYAEATGPKTQSVPAQPAVSPRPQPVATSALAAALAQVEQQFGIAQGTFSSLPFSHDLQQMQPRQPQRPQRQAPLVPRHVQPQLQVPQPQSLVVGRPQPQPYGPPGANLYINHIPEHFTDDDLRLVFEPFGVVLSAKVLTDKVTGQSKGSGMVSYAQPTQASSAIAAMHGFQLGAHQLVVQLKAQRAKPY